MTDEIKQADKFEIINELARRRGFFWGSYEIYGGVGGFVTYGFPGAKLKQNIEKKVRQLFVNKFGILEIEAPIIAPSKLFEASGHIENFKEPMVECLRCGRRFRADHLLREFTDIEESQAEKLSLKEVKEAVESAYGVSVREVRTMNYPVKRKTKYTKQGLVESMKGGFKKAVVQLADGDNIDFYSNI